MSYQGEFGVCFLVLIQRLRTRRKFSCRFFSPAKTSVDLPWEEVNGLDSQILDKFWRGVGLNLV
jgi:hypothetical protein